MADSAAAGRVSTVEHPDGRLDTFDYQWVTYLPDADPARCSYGPGGTALRTTVTHGTRESPSGIPHATTRDVFVVEANGDPVLSEVHVWTGAGWERIAWAVREFDDVGRVTAIHESDGTEYRAKWGVSGLASELLPDGLGYAYGYDSLGRLARIAKRRDGEPLVYAFGRDAQGNVLSEAIRVGDNSLVCRTDYDSAGRPTRFRSPVGLLWTADNGDAARTITLTQPGGGTETRSAYIDGRPAAVEGSAVVNARWDYGVDPDTGQRWLAACTGGIPESGTCRDAPIWVKVWNDALGWPVRSERPTSIPEQVVVSEISYDMSGHPLRVRDASRSTGNGPAGGPPARLGIDEGDAPGPKPLDRTTTMEAAHERDREGCWWSKRVLALQQGSDNGVPSQRWTRRTRLSGLGKTAPSPFSGVLVAEIRVQGPGGADRALRVYLDAEHGICWRVLGNGASGEEAVWKTTNGLLTESIAGDGAKRVYAYDAFERLIAVTETAGGRSSKIWQGPLRRSGPG
jgi:YD repeat-containing protein